MLPQARAGVCKQTYPPYAYARLRSVNRRGTRRLAELLAGGAAAALDGLGLCPSPAGARQASGAGRPSTPRSGLLGAPPRQRPQPQLTAAGSDAAPGSSALASGSESKTTAANAPQKEVSDSSRQRSGTAVPPARPARVAGAGTPGTTSPPGAGAERSLQPARCGRSTTGPAPAELQVPASRGRCLTAP